MIELRHETRRSSRRDCFLLADRGFAGPLPWPATRAGTVKVSVFPVSSSRLARERGSIQEQNVEMEMYAAILNLLFVVIERRRVRWLGK